MRFLLCRVWLRAGLLPSAYTRREGLIPGLLKVKSHYPRGAVDTNDLCINKSRSTKGHDLNK